MPKRRRDSTDPSSHHGFLDSLDAPKRKTKQNKRQGDDDDEPLDLDRIL